MQRCPSPATDCRGKSSAYSMTALDGVSNNKETPFAFIPSNIRPLLPRVLLNDCVVLRC